ncbi:MAG: hypothetical protein ABIP30_17060 [Ferruginibacter sp.]
MKKINSTVISALLTGLFIIGCNESAKRNMNDANKNLKEAGQDVKAAIVATSDTAKANAILNWNSFKSESDANISGMEKDLLTIKEKIAKANGTAKEKLQMDLDKTNKKLQNLKARLQQTNAEFEKNINQFDSAAVSKNLSFQREFKHDMNELGTAFKDLFKDNVK